MTRELVWGLRAVSCELDTWRRRARAIPDASIREDALDSIARKRGHADGAALFWILPRRRHPSLLALLVAYQTMWDFLDNVSERGAHAGRENGEMLHRALVAAIDAQAPLGEHYRHHPQDGDEGYLDALVRACREGCAKLPGFARVRPPALSETAGCAVQSINHEPDPAVRDAELRAWAARRCEPPEAGELRWFEMAAAASASLVPHVLLALAAEERCDPLDIAQARAAYMPWASLATAMLDSYADRIEDAASGDHSYLAHYGEDDAGRLAEILARAAGEVRRLRGGSRHAIILAGVVALYLSKDAARTPAERPRTGELVRSGGSLAELLLPVLRAWRTARALRSA
jgi:tetraprenyl-beta-curcumene synthase